MENINFAIILTLTNKLYNLIRETKNVINYVY